jgi:hypothetical protein
MLDKFLNKLRDRISRYDGTSKHTRKYVPLLKELLPKYEEHIDKQFVKFLKLGIITGFDSDLRKKYILTPAFTKWKFFLADALWGTKCANCDNQIKDVPLFNRPEHIYCSNSCAQSSPAVTTARETTFLANYGHSHATQSQKVIDQIRETMYKRHGGYTLTSPTLKKRVDATNKDRYGSKYVTQNPEVMAKVIATQDELYGGVGMASTLLRQKASDTYRERNGYCHQWADPKIQEKNRNTTRGRLGVDYASQSLAVQARNKETSLRRYGFDNPMKSPVTKRKVVRTMRDRYNCDSPMQHPPSREKQQRASSRIKRYTHQGRVFEAQSSYEAFMFGILADKYGLENVFTQFDPEFPDYSFQEMRTFPDLYVASRDLFIEVKSDYTLMGTPATLAANREKAARADNSGNKERWVVAYPKDNACVLLPRRWYTLPNEKLVGILSHKSNFR